MSASVKVGQPPRLSASNASTHIAYVLAIHKALVDDDSIAPSRAMTADSRSADIPRLLDTDVSRVHAHSSTILFRHYATVLVRFTRFAFTFNSIISC